MTTKRNFKENNFEEISKCHPEMILVSESPVTWQGFLLVSKLLYPVGYTRCPRVKVKLVMPNYPSFDEAQISFGKHIAFLRNEKFSREVKNSIKSQKTVLSFLSQLQLLIDKYIHNTDNKVYIPFDFESTKDFLDDIKAALQNQSDVQLSCDRNLNTIKLFLREIFLTLQRSKNIDIPWNVISSNMPENFKKVVVLSKNLNAVVTKFKWQVELLEKAWEQLKEIDENCWVIDPPKPNKCHLHRRIHLSQSICVTITIDPNAPTVVPTIQFSGSDNEVKRQMEDTSSNIHNWDPDCNILDNLRMLLNIYIFPEQQDSLDESQGVISNRQCGICFFELSETDELPNKICNNQKCMKHFHSTCLSMWLQTNAANQVVFEHIYGSCPHCKEDISCPIEC